MLQCKNDFWIENVTDIFCDFRIIPFKNMNLESQMNALSRLVIFIFIILLLFIDLKNSLIFLFTSLLIIIIFYYIKRKEMEKYKEMFTPNSRQNNINFNNQRVKGIPLTTDARADIVTNPRTGRKDIVVNDPNNFVWYDDAVLNPQDGSLKTQKEYVSINQKLAGAANPKTLIPPVIVPPAASLDFWKTNNLVTHSLVNDQKQIDNYQSGYFIATDCGADQSNMYVEDDSPTILINKPKKKQYTCSKGKYQINSTNTKEYTQFKENFQQQKNVKAQNNSKMEMPFEIKPAESGQINLACGYDAEQLYTAGLPTNYPSGKCEKDPTFKEYNKNLFTQTIQPGVYTRNQINEPINSNIGISFTQQFEPVSEDVDETGLTYIEHDPRLYEPVIEPYVETVNESNVYDPRFSGYGTSYRAYTDENIGQTKFYYDDINSVRMPNYIVRSNIDFMKEADTYGPMNNANGNEYNSVIRNLANNQYLDSSLQFRTELQQRLLRKTNAEAWQQRVAPIYKH